MPKQYYVRVVENGIVKYLFNTHVLLSDQALAKPFSSVLLARRYFRKTSFTALSHSVVSPSESKVIAFPSLGSIVE